MKERENSERIFSVILILFLSGFLYLGYLYLSSKNEEIISQEVERRLRESELERESEEIPSPLITEEERAEKKLHAFLEARIEKKIEILQNMITEKAQEQIKNPQSGVILLDHFQSYQIIGQEKIQDDEYKFLIKLRDNENNEYLESITVKKILDNFFIDSIEIPG